MKEAKYLAKNFFLHFHNFEKSSKIGRKSFKFDNRFSRLTRCRYRCRLIGFPYPINRPINRHRYITTIYANWRFSTVVNYFGLVHTFKYVCYSTYISRYVEKKISRQFGFVHTLLNKFVNLLPISRYVGKKMPADTWFQHKIGPYYASSMTVLIVTLFLSAS